MKKVFYFLLLSFFSFSSYAQIDAGVVSITHPPISCYGNPQIIYVDIINNGASNILTNGAAVTLKIGGSNTYVNTIKNSSPIAPGAKVTYTFAGIGLNNDGPNIDTAIVKLSGDIDPTNDTLISGTITATIISLYPIVEDFEAIPPVLPYVEKVTGVNQLWNLQIGDYTNGDQAQPLSPLGAPAKNNFYLFDSYNGAEGSISRLYSNCIDMPDLIDPLNPPVTTITFYASHDDLFPEKEDSIYMVISTDKGVTWERIYGVKRYDPLFITPGWKIEVVDISLYNNQTIQIGFEGVSKNGNVIGIDDININFSGPLPVSLLSFSAKKSGSINNLQWNTGRELNAKSFIVERSIDGKNFKQIGEVAATGNSNTTRSYFFTDMEPVKATNYYRIRIVDNGAAQKFSQVRNIKNTGVAEMIVAPNPVPSNMKVRIDAERTERGVMVVTDLSGKKVMTRTMNIVSGPNMLDIPMNNVSRGSYIVTLQLGEETIVRKINKL